MTKMDYDSKPVLRETRGRYRGTPLVVGITVDGVIVGEKGRRRASYYEIPAQVLYEVGAKLKAAEARKEKLAKKQATRKTGRKVMAW